MKSGEADGVPPLPTREARERWIEVFDAEFDRFCADLEAGKETFLDPYAAEHEAEFFAVASEAFFESPHALKRAHPKLYDLFAGFYRRTRSEASSLVGEHDAGFRDHLARRCRSRAMNASKAAALSPAGTAPVFSTRSFTSAGSSS
jgi:hypothetical protein